MLKFIVLVLTVVILAGCTAQTNIDQVIENNITQYPESDSKQIVSQDSDAVGYPIVCKPRMGFDNYRTEQAFAINPKNNLEMYINVEYKGLYKSIDGGKTWNFTGKGLKALPNSDDPSQPCYQLSFTLYIDSKNTQRILLPGGAAPSKVGMGIGGLSESLDSGKTWHQLFTSEMSAYTESAVTDPRDGNVIYVTTAALPQGMDGPDKGKIFTTKGVVYKSVDGGKTWIELPTGVYENLRVTGMFLDKNNPDKLRIATFGLPPGSNVDKKTTSEQWGFLETLDAGQTWKKIDSTLNLGIRYVDAAPANIDHFFIMATKDNIDKVYYTKDGKNLKEPNSPVNFVRYDQKDKTGSRIIGFNLYSQPNDIYESVDAGETWKPVGKLPEGIMNNNRASNIVFDPIEKDTIYINADMARLWKSIDKGKTWEKLLSIDTDGQFIV